MCSSISHRSCICACVSFNVTAHASLAHACTYAFEGTGHARVAVCGHVCIHIPDRVCVSTQRHNYYDVRMYASLCIGTKLLLPGQRIRPPHLMPRGYQGIHPLNENDNDDDADNGTAHCHLAANPRRRNIRAASGYQMHSRITKASPMVNNQKRL